MKGTFTQRTMQVACALSLLTSACSAPESRGIMPTTSAADTQPDEAVPGFTLSKYVKHVVIIVQENRSFENFFAGFKGADAPMYGYAEESNHGKVTKVNLQGNRLECAHHLSRRRVDVQGLRQRQMDQFNLVPFDKPPNQPSGTASYAYLKQTLIQPYRDMAYDYTLADHMFPTAWGGSFSAHLDLDRRNDADQQQRGGDGSELSRRGAATRRRARKRKSSTRSITGRATRPQIRRRGDRTRASRSLRRWPARSTTRRFRGSITRRR